MLVIYNDTEASLVERVCHEYVNDGGSVYMNGITIWDVDLPKELAHRLIMRGVDVQP